MRLKRLMTIICAFLLSVSMAFAQSSGDRLYNQGLALQKTMTISAQNQAISKFSSAKKLYDSAAKKAQCDQAISVSRNIIASLKGGGGAKGGGSVSRNQRNQTKEVKEVTPTLSLSNSEFDIDLNSKALSVTVNTNQDSWTVNTVACEDGSSFLKANKLGSSGFEIIVPQNPSCVSRTQKVIVTAGDLKREVAVTQSGRHVALDSNVKTFDFKVNGGKKDIDVSCDSDFKYEQNAMQNWYVESKPDWIIVTLNTKKGKNIFQKIGDGAKNLADKVMGGDNAPVNPKEVKTSVNIKCQGIKPGTAEQTTGRNGTIVLRSGDTTLTLYVNQIGKNSSIR